MKAVDLSLRTGCNRQKQSMLSPIETLQKTPRRILSNSTKTGLRVCPTLRLSGCVPSMAAIDKLPRRGGCRSVFMTSAENVLSSRNATVLCSTAPSNNPQRFFHERYNDVRVRAQRDPKHDSDISQRASNEPLHRLLSAPISYSRGDIRSLVCLPEHRRCSPGAPPSSIRAKPPKVVYDGVRMQTHLDRERE